MKELFFKYLNKVKKLKTIFLSRRFLRFCLFGCVNVLNTSFISWVCHLLYIQPNLAALLGYVISLSIAYVFNCRFIFKRKIQLKPLFRFYLSYVPSFIVYFLVTFITINTLELPQFWATLISTLIGSPLAFVIIWVYTFSQD